MTFHEVRFPADVAFGSSGGPEFSTEVVELASGFEKRNINWQAARARYNVAQGIKTQAQLDIIIAFFRARKGMAHGFRFKDHTDYKVTGQVLGNGNGVITAFQAVKYYSSGAVTESRAIKKLVSGSLKIYLNGVLQNSGYSADNNTGIVTFSSAPANGVIVSADFEFDVPVRFDTDFLSASVETYKALAHANIPLVEIKI